MIVTSLRTFVSSFITYVAQLLPDLPGDPELRAGHGLHPHPPGRPAGGLLLGGQAHRHRRLAQANLDT